MSAFDFICPLKETLPADLVKLAFNIWPVASKKGHALTEQAIVLDPKDIALETYVVNPVGIGEINDLEYVTEVPTYHAFVSTAPGLYRPSAAAVLIQIQGTVEIYKEKDVRITAYENNAPFYKEPNAFENNLRLLHETGRSIEILTAKEAEEKYGSQSALFPRVQMGKATLFTGTLPETTRARPLRCRGLSYLPDPSIAAATPL